VLDSADTLKAMLDAAILALTAQSIGAEEGTVLWSDTLMVGCHQGILALPFGGNWVSRYFLIGSFFRPTI